MQYTKLLETVWLIASREAIAASWKEIQPGHFSIGILKVSEISPSELMAQGAVDTNIIREFTEEINQLQLFLKNGKIDSAILRRELRSKLGSGNEVYSGDVMHRSEKCKQLFSEVEQVCMSNGKSIIGLIDIFNIFQKENILDKKGNKSHISNHQEELNQFAVLFNKMLTHYIEHGGNGDHPVEISLSKRILHQTKGILMLYEELHYAYLHLSIISDELLIQSQTKIFHLDTTKNITEYEFIELIDKYTREEKSFLILPAIENEKELEFSLTALNRFFDQTNIPSKIIVPVNIKLQQWWYSQCPKSKLFLSPMICNNDSFNKDLSIDKV